MTYLHTTESFKTLLDTKTLTQGTTYSFRSRKDAVDAANLVAAQTGFEVLWTGSPQQLEVV